MIMNVVMSFTNIQVTSLLMIIITSLMRGECLMNNEPLWQ